jgi:hypothetical protein
MSILRGIDPRDGMSEGARTPFYHGNGARATPIGDMRGGEGKKVDITAIFFPKTGNFQFSWDGFSQEWGIISN